MYSTHHVDCDMGMDTATLLRDGTGELELDVLSITCVCGHMTVGGAGQQSHDNYEEHAV